MIDDRKPLPPPPRIVFNPRLIDMPGERRNTRPSARFVLLACGDPSVPDGACYRYGSHTYATYEAAQEAAAALADTYRPLWGDGALFLAYDEGTADRLVREHWRYDPHARKPPPGREHWR